MTRASRTLRIAAFLAASAVGAESPAVDDGMLPVGDTGLRMDPYEVTNRQMAACLNEVGNPRVKGAALVEVTSAYAHVKEVDGLFRPQEGFADHPAVEVSFGGARAYCEWAGKRLPTAAEWQRACEGPAKLAYPWGNGYFDDAPEGIRRSNIAGDGDGYARTAPVGSFPDGRSPYGLWDMSGNVWEWTMGPEGAPMLRGGSWADGETLARCDRGDDPTSFHSYFKGSAVGFRCAR